MASAEEKAAARRAKILARGEDRMKLLRGEKEHLEPVATESLKAPDSKPESSVPSQQDDAEKLLDDALAEVTSSKPKLKVDSASSHSTSDTSADTNQRKVEAGSAKSTAAVVAPVPAPAAAAPAPVAAPSPAPAPAAKPAPPAAESKPAAAPASSTTQVAPAGQAQATSFADRARITKRVGQIYGIKDFLTAAAPILLGLLFAWLSMGCGWVSVSFDGGSAGPLVRNLASLIAGRAGGSAAGAGVGSSDIDAADELRSGALSRLSGLPDAGSSGLGLGIGGAVNSQGAYGLRPLPPLPEVLFPHSMHGVCDSVYPSVQAARAAPLALSLLMAWSTALSWAADEAVRRAAGPQHVRQAGGMAEGMLGLLTSFTGGGRTSAGKNALSLLPTVLRATTAVSAAFKQATSLVVTFLITIALAAALSSFKAVADESNGGSAAAGEL